MDFNTEVYPCILTHLIQCVLEYTDIPHYFNYDVCMHKYFKAKEW